jgi:oxygen-dependent protoporphyrinogen oxidase
MKKVVIIGGGISGLTVAYVLRRRNEDLDITVLEADGRPGGKIWSEQADGFLCERGPNGFLDNKPRTLELCDSLGIEPVRSNENSKRRFIYVNRKLNPLPESPPAFIKSDLISVSGKLRLLFELIAPKGPPDETVADFILRRLGREALEKLIDPMTSGIYAGDPYKMSIKSCFPRIKELEQEYGSLIRALIKIRKKKKAEMKGKESAGVSVAPGGTLTSFYDGAQTITDSIAGELGGIVRLGVSVRGVAKNGTSYQVQTSDETIETDIVIAATPAYVSATMLRDLDRGLSDTLSTIPYPHVSVVCFGYKREKVKHPLDGFGFLIPYIEGRRILGNLWDSSIFPNRASEGHVLLRTMAGGSKFPEIGGLDDDKLVSLVFDELKPILRLTGEPDMLRTYRWDRAIPQYLIGHEGTLNTLDTILKRYPGLYLTGNAYRGIGINDCVENGYKLAEEVLQTLPA